MYPFSIAILAHDREIECRLGSIVRLKMNMIQVIAVDPEVHSNSSPPHKSDPAWTPNIFFARGPQTAFARGPQTAFAR